MTRLRRFRPFVSPLSTPAEVGPKAALDDGPTDGRGEPDIRTRFLQALVPEKILLVLIALAIAIVCAALAFKNA
jgi:hypothetical protein